MRWRRWRLKHRNSCCTAANNTSPKDPSHTNIDWRNALRKHLEGMQRDDGDVRFPTIGRLVHKVASHAVGATKPDEAIYRAFEQLCGEHGDAILFFDDLEANISVALDIGWRAELIDPLGDPAAQMRSHLRDHEVL